jgi:hypothetical protein
MKGRELLEKLPSYLFLENDCVTWNVLQNVREVEISDITWKCGTFTAINSSRNFLRRPTYAKAKFATAWTSVSSLPSPVLLSWTAGWTSGFDSRQRKYFSILHSVQTSSGAHPASYPTGTGGGAISSCGKRSGSETDHSSASTVGAIPPLPHAFLWHGA